MEPIRSDSPVVECYPLCHSAAEIDRTVLDEDDFQKMIALERQRASRAQKQFSLILVDMGDSLPSSKNARKLVGIADALACATRDIDWTGWYKQGRVVGVLFTEIAADQKSTLLAALFNRVCSVLRDTLSGEQFRRIRISAHLYPEDWEHELAHRPSDPVLYPDLLHRANSRKFAATIKRAMDVVGSLVGLTLFAPLFAAIAVAIKVTSKGPIFFKQERVGEHGRPFIFLKFRSMHTNNDERVHKQWFDNFVSGQAKLHKTAGNGGGVFKMTVDPRVTRIGRILRRTSLDELPQFINVLKGEMSLVGPRPPIPYEVDSYQTWHRGRILEAKPGLTGLWQVSGRSRVTFDEMVRLDLQYARTWSLWLDIKILLQTPRAVLFGDGAY